MIDRVEELSEQLKQALRDGRNAIIGRGGDINPTAGFRAFPSAIYNIPADNILTTVTCEEVSLGCAVPINTTGYAYIAEFGGISRGGDGSIMDDALSSIVSWGTEGEIDRFEVPPEILALDGYGEGLSINYYNKVNLVDDKYKKCIVTKILDNPSDWRSGALEGQDTNYFVCKLGERGTFATRVCVSDKFERVHISSSTTEVGIDVFDSSAFGGYMVAIRPANVQDYTIDTFKKWIKENPVTLKYALLVPEEYDLPVYVNPLIRVEPSEMGLELFPSDGQGIPHKIVMQTLTQ